MPEEQTTQPEEGKEPTAEGQKPSEEHERIDVWGLLQYCLTVLHSYAWQSMGLVANPATGKIDKDLEQAQVAIDAVSSLAGQLETRLKGEELRQLRAMVSDLQLNFVQQQKSADK